MAFFLVCYMKSRIPKCTKLMEPDFSKKKSIPPISEKRVQNYSQIQGERPVEDIGNSNIFRMRGNIYVHFFINTITDIIYWNFHVFYRKICRKYKIILSSSPSPHNNVGCFHVAKSSSCSYKIFCFDQYCTNKVEQ